MSRPWAATVESHRRDVREAILDTTWALALEHGPASTTMSEVAEKVGIGRATLYRYFPDIATILAAWHERQINRHLEHLSTVRDSKTDPGKRLCAVLEAYAEIHLRRAENQRREMHGAQVESLMHTNERVAESQRQLHGLLQGVIADAAAAGRIRDDINPFELANYCLFAITGANSLESKAAVQRLVSLTLTGLRYQD
ncbi:MULTISPECIES: TetR/AcrR family transcriptional regulator [Nocardia]|uniref:Transcriptional regulator n=2 Tax=Nocardia TaxID=1817 RepID=K0ERV8_NOCB7|nr:MULTISPECIES: TetR/AcrR family transcriptional regulator [Nocardia]AFT99559.1 transcriptional regulator [Nocardia brasiliensis ATCC 700358]KIA64424.1 TetR family transcriptional regulator [Nocardia vulneris]OCF90504.1 TetR family transcriptional regulator [Nocardia brasiliensis]